MKKFTFFNYIVGRGEESVAELNVVLSPFGLKTDYYKKGGKLPVTVKKGSGVKPWKIVEVATGRVVGSSKSKRDAEISASYRNKAIEKRGR